MTRSLTITADDRGIRYANGGDNEGTIHYADPDRIAAINSWWNDPANVEAGVVTAAQLQAHFDKCVERSQKPSEYVVFVHPKLYERLHK